MTPVIDNQRPRAVYRRSNYSHIQIGAQLKMRALVYHEHG